MAAAAAAVAVARMLLVLALVAASTAGFQASPPSSTSPLLSSFHTWSDQLNRITTTTITTRNTAPSISRLPLFLRFATTGDHNGNAMDDDADYYHQTHNSMTSTMMTPPESRNSRTSSSSSSSSYSSSSISHESKDRNYRSNNQRPPRWQPQRSTTPPNQTTTGADALATEMENASRRTITDNFYALQTHPSSTHSSSSFQQIQNDEDSDINDPHVMEFANYIFALQAKMESELEKSTTSTTPTTSIYDTSISDASSISEVPMSEMPQPQQYQMQQMNEEKKREGTVPITAADDIMGDAFLKMLSNEVRYKQLINQSPYSLADVEFSVLIQRFLDNIEDGMQKKNGKFAGMSKLKRISMPRENRKTIVVVSVCMRVCEREIESISIAG